MSKISCEVCMDLIPLVRDGIASQDSKQAVEQHTADCAVCRRLLGGAAVPETHMEQVFGRLKRKMRLFYALLMMFGIAFGVGLTGGVDMFYNSLIMPFIGAVGYLVFRWDALYLVPLLLVLSNGATNLFAILRGNNSLDLLSLLFYTFLYSLFSGIGTHIAGFLHTSVQKEEGKSKGRRAAYMVAAVAMAAGMGFFANQLLGNPISRMLAARTAQHYVAQQYPDTDFYVDEVSYSFKDGHYIASVVSPTSPDSAFTLGMGKGGALRWDDYEDQVTSGRNTAQRLEMAYRDLSRTVLDSPTFPFVQHITYGELKFDRRQPQDEAASPLVLLEGEELERDRPYDIPKLGSRIGHLVLYIEDETVSVERAAQIMVEIKSRMEEGGVPFATMDFVLEYPKPEGDGERKEGCIKVLDFPCADIREEGMAQRVEAANEAAIAYHAQQDAARSQAG